MRQELIRWIPSLTPGELRADLASSSGLAVTPAPAIDHAWRSWPAPSIDGLWASDSAPPIEFLAILRAADAIRPAVFVIARGAAAEAAGEATGGSREHAALAHLAAGDGLRSPAAAWLPFDDRKLDAIGWIAGRQAIEALSRRVGALGCGTLPVLVTGETGVGKELVARALHRSSPRAMGPWLALNCAALSESLLESELFGHRRGAFTGAIHDRAGLLATAGSGTLFLDEIGELPLSAQAKLLRAIEERRVRPLGGDHGRAIECRIVAATHRDLAAEVAAGRFRGDLLYRLRGATVELPALRIHRGDVDHLAQTFALRACIRLGLEAVEFSLAARQRLREHSWPGNVRELRQAVEAAVLVAAGSRIEADDLGLAAAANPAAMAIPTIREVERRSLVTALEATGGNRVAAARLLGLSRQSLARRLHRHGLPPSRGLGTVAAARRSS